jgi:hypothetical protein
VACKGANQLRQDSDVEIDGSLHVLNLPKYGVCTDETDAVELLQNCRRTEEASRRARNGSGQRGRADVAQTSESQVETLALECGSCRGRRRAVIEDEDGACVRARGRACS